MQAVKIIECPRDAWQGLPAVIPTEAKIAYLRRLLECGFGHLDAVSFVSPKYIPQMADSELVMEALYQALGPAPRNLSPEIIGIVVNEAGLERALKTPGLTTIGYPYSVSAHFRRANANMSKAESQALVDKLQKTVSAPDAPVRNLVVYISMAFGNNYNEPWGSEIVIEAVEWLREIGVKQVSLADTIGTASADEVSHLYKSVKLAISNSASARGSVSRLSVDPPSSLEIGVHLHGLPQDAAEKVLAAYEAGCRRFDCALTGLGGCPFAGNDLVGNIPTEIVVPTLSAKGVETGIEPWALLSALKATRELRKKFT
jgi:hydroxymethylglutaryl-CoA lyase